MGLLIILKADCGWTYTSEDCIRCHEEGSTGSVLRISVKEFESSVHGRDMTCEDCHAGVEDGGHETTKGSGAVNCGQCHEQKNRHGLQSKTGMYPGIHRPRCYSCHTRHNILEKDRVESSVHPGQLKETCRACHPAECGETDYLSKLPSMQIASHNKQDFNRSYEKDNCIGCHQGLAAHGESEPVNDQDCYKCHAPQKGHAPLWGYIHPKADLEKQPSVFWAAVIYQFFIVVLLWGGFRFFVLKFSGRSGLGR